MSAPADWEAFLAEHFPAYLLPQAYCRALPAEAAARFLDRLYTNDPRDLFLLRAVSFLAAHAGEIRAFVFEELPLLISSLPPRAHADARLVTGAIEGRLDIPATLKQRLEGRAGHAIIRSPRIRFDRPEALLLKAVAARLLEVFRAIRGAGGAALASSRAFLQKQQNQNLSACEEALDRALTATSLGALPNEVITPFHERAAIEARRPGFALAASLHRALWEGLDADDPEIVASIVAKGALLPLEAPARFEIAVLIRLIQALFRRVEEREPGRWRLHRTIILPDRGDVAELEREGGGRVRVFYNQAVLSPGPHDRGVRHYLGQQGRLRPDITVVMDNPSGVSRAAVVEIKLSSEPDYLAQGYRQALVYRHEFTRDLTTWPKAILVCSAEVQGAPRREDDVIAVGWKMWPPESVLDGWLHDFF
jgi:hypothetical protein